MTLMNNTANLVELTTSEAASLLQCAPNTVRSLARRGQLRYRLSRGLHELRFDIAEVERLAAYRRAHPERRGRKNRIRDLVQQSESGSGFERASSRSAAVRSRLRSPDPGDYPTRIMTREEFFRRDDLI